VVITVVVPTFVVRRWTASEAPVALRGDVKRFRSRRDRQRHHHVSQSEK
jgi:hypothetical protein